MKSDKWLELDKYKSERDVLPFVLPGLPKSVTTALNVFTRRLSGRVVVELHE